MPVEAHAFLLVRIIHCIFKKDNRCLFVVQVWLVILLPKINQCILLAGYESFGDLTTEGDTNRERGGTRFD